MEEFNTQFSTETQETPEDDRPPLWKQVMGAVIGGGLALGLYYGYEYAKPKVTAYLTLPVAEGGRMFDLGAASIADKSLEQEERKRFISKNLQAAERMLGLKHDPARMAAADDHSLDIDWPGHDAPEADEVAEADDMPMEMAMEEEADTEAFDVFLEQEMATMNQEPTDEWEDLWGDIRDREEGSSAQYVERSNANALPDTGVSLVIVAAGAAGGAMGVRKRRKKNQ